MVEEVKPVADIPAALMDGRPLLGMSDKNAPHYRYFVMYYSPHLLNWYSIPGTHCVRPTHYAELG